MSYTYEKLAELSFQIITFAGCAKSDAMEAIYAAKVGKFDEAKEKMSSAHKNLIEAEKQHAELIQKEAQGVEIRIPLLFMHAEDQMLCTQTLMILADEIIDLHKEMKSK
ncbi:MAG: PTS lactose/cellobiose transporter subunit IIA [Mycoplasma sp.]